MIKNWCYWRRYHPDYRIVDKGKLKIEKIDNSYKMSLSITLTFETKDDLEELMIDCKEICLKIDSPKNKGRKKSYELIYSTGENETLWRFLPSAKPLEVKYILIGWTMGKPRLGNTIRCQVQSIGIARLKGITKNLKIKQPFDIDVIWEGNNTNG